MNLEELTEEELIGIKMVSFLQRINQVDESHESALRKWRSMSEDEKFEVKRAYEVLSK